MTKFRTNPRGRVYPLSDRDQAPPRAQLWMAELYDRPADKSEDTEEAETHPADQSRVAPKRAAKEARRGTSRT